jgi:two-component system cell cycle sensor histidine kinase/response regulator CckA
MEQERLHTLRSYGVLDTAGERDFDDLVALAAGICEAPIALISLVDEDRQWFKAAFGLTAKETSRDVSFCAHAIHQPDLFVVQDASRDERFSANPLVTGDPGIRFYAGSPLIAPDGLALGTLCVIDRQPRQLTPAQKQALSVLSRHVMAHLELRRQTTKMARTNRALLGILEDQRRAEELVSLSNERFQLAAHATNDVIWDWDLVADSFWWNDCFQTLFGYQPNEIEPGVESWTNRLHPDDAARIKAGISQLVEGSGSTWSDAYRFRRKDGTYADIFDRSYVIRNNAGQAIRMVGAMTDLTERNTTAKQLLLLRTSIANLNDTVMITEADLLDEPGPKIVFVNEAFERLTGYTFAEVIGRSPRFLQGKNTNRKVLDEIREALSQQKPIRRQLANYSKDGTEYWLDIDIVPILDASGKCAHFVAIERDITEQRKSEERIAEQASFLDQARDAIFVRDMEGVIQFWNQGAERLYGWTRQEAIGRNLVEVLQGDPKLFPVITGQTLAKGEWMGDLRHIAKDGRELIVEARSTLMRDKEGHPKSILAINTDVTEKKKMEAQFMRAQRMESIGTLAGGIAHDLNNILAPILMSIDVLKTSSEDPQAQSILQTIEVSAKRGADIVRQVLSFARGIEGQRIEVQPKHLVDDLEKIVKDTFPKDIRLRFSIGKNPWTILGDPTQLHQILLNLSVNARDAMPTGGELVVDMENCLIDELYAVSHLEAKPGRYVKMGVSDTGTGIPAHIVEKIFEPFFTTKELSKGTGLGLSTVMGIVKSHNGFINVYSEPNKGTKFNVYLPALEITSEPSDGDSAQLDLPTGNGETILVVDDEASILTITSQTLQAFGYHVITASDGAEAVSIYASHRDEISVVLTDMMMPVMDGPATIHALTSLNPAIKIIAASGLNANGAVTKMPEAGVQHFLTKPYTTGELLRALRSIIGEG